MTASPDAPRILGAVYTGGASTRFKRDKSTALYHGRTFLDHVISSIVMQVDALVLLGGAARPPWPVLQDSVSDTGPFGGLLAALRYANEFDYDWLATAPCDTPELPHDYVVKMLHVTVGVTNVVVAQTACGLQPTVALWRVQSALPVMATIKQGFSLRAAIMCATPFVAVSFPKAALANINDQTALAKLRGHTHFS